MKGGEVEAARAILVRTRLKRQRLWVVKKKLTRTLGMNRNMREIRETRGLMGKKQLGTVSERLKRQLAFKLKVAERLFRASRPLTIGKHGSDATLELMKKVEAVKWEYIVETVNRAVGFKARMLGQFLGKYRKIVDEVQVWKSKIDASLAALEVLTVGEGEAIVAVTYEDMMRPEYTAYHDRNRKERTDDGKERDKARSEEWKARLLEAVAADTMTEAEMQKRAREVPCDDTCILPKRWGERIGAKLEALRPCEHGGNYGAAFAMLYGLEECDGCLEYPSAIGVKGLSDGVREGTEEDEARLCLREGNGSGCLDAIRLMLRVRNHSKKMANFLREVYRVRRLMRIVMDVESALDEGDLHALEVALNIESSDDNVEEEGGVVRQLLGPELRATKLEEKYGKLAEKFRAREKDHPLAVCTFCDRRVSERNKIGGLTSICGIDAKYKAKLGLFKTLARQMGKESVDLSDDGVKDLVKSGKLVCCTTCWPYVGKGQVGGPMLENGMELDDVPDELACLNYYETIMISRIRPFYSVVSLKPYGGSGLPQHLLVKATKGNVAMLRMSTGKTTEYVAGSLPVSDVLPLEDAEMRIYTYVQTNAGKLWSNLVDMDKVLDALVWLKKHNKTYEKVTIDHEAIKRLRKAGAKYVILSEETEAKAVEEGQESALPADVVEEPEVVEEPDVPFLQVAPELRAQQGKHTVDQVVSLAEADTPQVLFGKHLETYKQIGRVEGQPVRQQDKGLDVKTFPMLYPQGRGGLDADRTRNVRPREYFKYMLERRDLRFQQNPMWMHVAHYYKLDRQISAGIFATTKTSVSGGMNREALLAKLAAKDEALEHEVSSMFRNIKGTSEYWDMQKGNLSVMDEMLGPATWYMTLSCAEYHWPELEKYIREKHKDKPDIAKMSQRDLVAFDRVAVSEFFHRRFKAFWNEVVLKPDGPFGEVEEWYWRLEYQARGAPHIHAKLWVKDAPTLGAEGVTSEEVLNYIANHVTAKIPKEDDNLELRKMVDTYQMHKCTKSCLRSKVVNKRWVMKCRYGFPMMVSECYQLNDFEESVKSRHGRGRTKKLYQVKREQHERNVNWYNPTVLQLWGANVDVQFLGEFSRVLNGYITGYITKGEKGATDELWKSVRGDDSAPSALRKVACASMRSREVGIYEIIDDMLGHDLHGSSTAVEWLPAGMPGNRRRKLLTVDQITQLPAGSTDLFAKNIVVDYYPQRNDSLEDYSLHEIASKWRYEREQHPKRKMSEAELSNPRKRLCRDKKGWFKERTKRVFLKTFWATRMSEDPVKTEQFYHLLLQCHVPFRDESELKRGKDTFEEAFKEWVEIETAKVEEGIVEESGLLEALKRKERTEQSEKLRSRLENEAEEELGNDEEEMVEDENLDSGVGMPEGFRKRPGYGTEEGLKSRVEELNVGQSKVFNEVMTQIRKQMDHDAKHGKDCVCEEKPKPVRTFVSGSAGVGKSKLIETITEAVEMESKENVMLGAPTGMAAANIDGQTLHRLFQLNVQKGQKEPWKYVKLGAQASRELANRVSKTRLLVIDEISMVSNKMLMFLHQRLVDAFGASQDEPFAGFNVMVLGDLLQLPPVGDSSFAGQGMFCFERMSRSQWQETFVGSVALSKAPDLWNKFEYYELTQNMRQAKDAEFGEILNDLRIGMLSEEAQKTLESRLVSQAEVEKDRKFSTSEIAKVLLGLVKDGKKPVCLLPKNDMVTGVNNAMLVKLGIQLKYLHALDVTRSRKKRKKFVAGPSGGNGKTDEEQISELNEYTRKEMGGQKQSETGGLAGVVALGVGARVMLTSNVSVEAGLFNGAVGNVVRFVKSASEEDKVRAVVVKFDNVEEEHEIKRISTKYKGRGMLEVSRSQFPLRVCYAMSVHKSQGMSLDCVVTYIAKEIFAPGQSYVALSRCRSLEGLHLIGFEPERIWAERRAIVEYNRLRKEFTELPELKAGNVKQPVEKKKATVVRNIADTMGGLVSDEGVESESAPVVGRKRKSLEKDTTTPKKAKVVSTPVVRKQKKTVSATASKVLVAKAKKVSVASRPRTQLLRDSELIGSFVPLINRKNDCFANAALQAWLGTESVRAWMMDEGRDGLVTKEIRDELRRLVHEEIGGGSQPQSSAGLMQTVTHGSMSELQAVRHYLNGQQHDSWEFLKTMFSLCDEVRNMFSYKVAKRIRCENPECGVTRTISELMEHEVILDRPMSGSETLSSLLSQWGKKERVKTRCLNCCADEEHLEAAARSEGVWGETWWTGSALDTTKNILLVIPRFRAREGQVWTDRQVAGTKCDGKITEFDPNLVHFGGKRWKASALVMHRGENVNSGHYWTLVNHDHDGVGWVKKDDQIGERIDQLPDGMEGVYYVMLTRLHDQ